MAKLSVKGFAMGCGIVWGAGMLFSGWAAIFGWCTKFVEVMGSIYLGFKPTFLGGIVGAVWGFIDGAIGGAIVSLVYNYLVEKK